jgi:DNA primase
MRVILTFIPHFLYYEQEEHKERHQQKKKKEKKIIAVCFYGRLMDCLFQAMSEKLQKLWKTKNKNFSQSIICSRLYSIRTGRHLP